MGVRAVDPGVPRVEDRREPRDRPQRPFPSTGEDESAPKDRDAPPDAELDADPEPDPERLVDIRVAPHLLPTRQVLPHSAHAHGFA